MVRELLTAKQWWGVTDRGGMLGEVLTGEQWWESY